MCDQLCLRTSCTFVCMYQNTECLRGKLYLSTMMTTNNYAWIQLHLNYLCSCQTIRVQLFDLATVTKFYPVQNQQNKAQRNIIFTSQFEYCFSCSLRLNGSEERLNVISICVPSKFKKQLFCKIKKDMDII